MTLRENDFKPESMIEGWMMMMMTIMENMEPLLYLNELECERDGCCHKANHICIHHHYRKYLIM